ncbi:MAG: hypothetical protein U5Q44_03740 [Dehalococcoidia bacterium]|nr:hypothetical protein [Dehalococcoidia bacterium]
MFLNNVLRLPTILVPGTVAILCVIAGLVGLWFAEVLEDETDQLGEAGAVALSVSELRQSTYQIETFVAEEHLRLQSGVAGAVPISRVFEADATRCPGCRGR